MNILLFGPPGAGKGTQSGLLVERLEFKQISTGDLLRSATKNKSELGLKAQEFMSKGQLVPDSLVISLVEEELAKTEKSFILDGFPRTVVQAEELDKLMIKVGKSIQKAIFISVPFSILTDRLVGRRVCRACSSVFHVKTKPEKKSGVCDNCGGELYQRNDDKAEVIEERLKAYQSHTAPLIEYYKKLGKYFEVDGNRDEAAVFISIEKILN